MRVYLSGKISNVPGGNRLMFEREAAKLKELGHDVYNPSAKDIERWGYTNGKLSQQRRRIALAADCKFLCERADAVAFISGWEKGRASRMEWALANALNLKIIYLN